jgi:hypothetical protein
LDKLQSLVRGKLDSFEFEEEIKSIYAAIEVIDIAGKSSSIRQQGIRP